MPELRPVAVFNGHPALICPEDEVVRFFHLLDRWQPFAIPAGELSIALLTDDALARLHQSFLDDPATTDVITFPPDESDGLAGEICVSADTAQRTAPGHNWSFSEELTLYLVHGWLHLAGLLDKHSDQSAAMRRAEKQALDWINGHRALPAFGWKNQAPRPHT